jgi:hypothetical protein
MIVRKILSGIILVIISVNVSMGQMDDFMWNENIIPAQSSDYKLTGTKYLYSLHSNAHHFLHKEWYPGRLITADGSEIRDIKLRYDAFNDELVVYNSKVLGLFVVDKYSVSGFEVEIPQTSGQLFKKLYLPEFSTKEHYLQVHYAGYVSLLSANRIVERKTSFYKNKFGKLEDRNYELVQQYIVQYPDQSLKRIIPGRKSLMNLFPARKKELRKLFRVNHIYDFGNAGIPGIVALLDKEGYFGKKPAD